MKLLKWFVNIIVTAVATVALLFGGVYIGHDKGWINCSDNSCECNEVVSNDSNQSTDQPVESAQTQKED